MAKKKNDEAPEEEETFQELYERAIWFYRGREKEIVLSSDRGAPDSRGLVLAMTLHDQEAIANKGTGVSWKTKKSLIKIMQGYADALDVDME
jgi:hypothetical protein